MQPAADESAELRRRGRLSIAGFVLFWVVTLSLILAVELLDASPVVKSAAIASILVTTAAGIALHLSTRCPVCAYRLGYQRSLGVPPRCERCGAQLF